MSLLEKYKKHPGKKDNLTKSEDIVFSIFNEMDGRKGLLGFDNCDEDTQEEILDTLVEIVNEKIEE